LNYSYSRFDYLHKKQSGGAGQYARVIGILEVDFLKIHFRYLFLFFNNFSLFLRINSPLLVSFQRNKTKDFSTNDFQNSPMKHREQMFHRNLSLRLKK